jgi:small-conductance mechanosensitive channel
MANSTIVPAAENHTRIRAFGRTRIAGLVALLVLLAFCLVFSWTTRDAVAYLSFLRAQRGRSGTAQGNKTLVDLRPWQTIQTLAPMAVSTEELGYADEAKRLADHEVDQAFASALRLASLQASHRKLDGDTLALSQKVSQLEQIVKQDQAQVASLTAKVSQQTSSSKNEAQTAAGSDDLDTAKAQLGLDADELADAQKDLARALGDNSDQIQQELTAHEAAAKESENAAHGGGQVAVLSAQQHRTLYTRMISWWNQRERYQLLQQALQQTQTDINALTAERQTFHARYGTSITAPSSNEPDRASSLATLKDKSTERQILSIYDDRIQTDQELAGVYGKWSSQLLLQHRIVFHMIMQSLMLIIILLMCMILIDALVRHLMAHPALDRRQAHTLRSVIELSIQIVGALIILFIIFGTPQETPTILGLTTAALTIALQDFILAFFGWFVLVGKNGIHVGDWVEINGVGGEVAEVGLISTTLLETGKLPDKGHLTGRRISFINSYAIRGQFFNFSTTGQWMWDEISVSVPASADLHAITNRIQQAVTADTETNSRLAEQDWNRGSKSGALGHFSAAAELSMRPTPSGVDVSVRYVTRASERPNMRDRLYMHLIELLRKPSPDADESHSDSDAASGIASGIA